MCQEMDPKKKVFVDEIRRVHKDLRRKYREESDFDTVWDSHCQDVSSLEKYAQSMQDLATEIWDNSCDGENRIKWCRDVCNKYFKEGGMEKILEKDERRRKHYQEDESSFICGPNPSAEHEDAVQETSVCFTKDYDKLCLLDVGSCYDPFREFEEFETTAIDLRPANENVHYCDFTKVEVSAKKEEIEEFERKLSKLREKESAKTHGEICLDRQTSDRGRETKIEITNLPANYFHIIVFSLLLTYIPSPHVRWKFCEKAHKLLSVNGLLLIISPDSSHQNKHAALMKKWKNAIEWIGFQRLEYRKDTHLHFMTFRKVPNNFLWDKRKTESIFCDDGHLCLNIPQDFQESDEETETEYVNITEDFLETCNELPLI